MTERIYLSPPHMSGKEFELVQQVFEGNWIAPIGPMLDRFERDFCAYTGTKYALALSSGTAAIHLALIAADVGTGDEVFVSTLTFIGSVNPILYCGAIPVFIDSDPLSWTMDVNLLEEALHKRNLENRLPKALIVVHLYGQSADMARINTICEQYGVTVIEDAAESLGSRYHDKHPGTLSKFGIFSFNGNKIITTSGGGMLVSDDGELIQFARKLATQSREAVPHYEHKIIGYNYRMSNVVAAIGVGQLSVIEDRVQRKREIYKIYQQHLAHIQGITLPDEMNYGKHSRWLSVMLIDADITGITREEIRLVLETNNIESRPMWKPMHQQSFLKDYEVIGGSVSDKLFEQGLCLPSGTALSNQQFDMIINIITSSVL
ncbi:MAG: aminotransferase class I/II-fold pyridoxal phosphate-dependent enzyme [Chloroflexota bacterium]